VQYVKFVTSDYAMQNVIIQMGFQLLGLDGMLITRVKRFKLLCTACGTINMETDRMFCFKCGGSTLSKVSVYMNSDGQLTFFNNPRRKINLRGKIYSIPDPKGGRGCKDLILREDDLLRGEYKQMAHKIKRHEKKEMSAITDTLEGNYWAGGAGYGSHCVSNLLYEDGAKGGKTHSKGGLGRIQVGYGKKNPNKAVKKV
jgi:RNA-binding protein NOB1